MYEKQNFYAGQILKASHLNKIEDGIIEALNREAVSSWDDLTNKPFEELPPEFDIQWDGNMEGHETFQMDEGVYFVKVSDEIYNREQLLGATFYSNGGHEAVLTEERLDGDSCAGAIWDDVLIIYSADDFINEQELPEGSFSNGVWFLNDTVEGYYVNRIVGAPIIKKIDEKFLPEKVVGENILYDITWDGNMEGHDSLDMTPYGQEGVTLVKVSDQLFPVIDNLVGATLCINLDDPIIITEDDIDFESIPGVVSISSPSICIVHTAEDVNAALGLPEGAASNGIWFACAPDEGVYVNRFVNSEIIKLDSKYLPTNVPALATATVGQAVVVKAVDEDGKPIEYEAGDVSSSWNDLEDKPEFATAAISGSYNDLTDKPVGINYNYNEIYNGRNGALFVDNQIAYIKLTTPLINKQRYKIKISCPTSALEFESILSVLIADSPTVYAVTSVLESGFHVNISNATREGQITLQFSAKPLTTGEFWTIVVYEMVESTIRLDETYLPESVGSIIVRSSTEGSSKKFKITVDDSGTISATEVTE